MTFLYQKSRCLIEAFSLHLKHLLLFLPTTMYEGSKKSTIYCSQWTPSGWHEKLGGGAVADAILDRIVNSSYMIELKGNSLREEYSRLK